MGGSHGSVLILETPRLRVERFTLDDAEFILRLLNEPSFILYIADKGVRTLDDARGYLSSGPLAHYQRHGFGLWRLCERATGVPIGMCGLIQRDALEDVDIGYALLSEFGGKGYAREAAGAVVRYARDVVGLDRLVAVVSVGNQRSIRLLERLGFTFERLVRLPPDEEEIGLYALETASLADAMRDPDTQKETS
jgi:RimJ/RimL family protein N-acetyltransferase